MNYSDFLHEKTHIGCQHGFDPLWIPDTLYPFQKHLTTWAIQKGRAAIFADCGLGKTLMQLVWAENVARKTGRPVLILTPLAVSYQTQREAEKFSIEAERCQDGKFSGGIVVTNYERLQHFKAANFSGVVCDESSILKNFDGKRRTQITEFMRSMPYRLLCTATAAPNDYHELGTSSEALGELGYADMITRFFKEDTIKDYLGWGRKSYRFRGHAEEPFWRWVCSWARAIRRPSDLGYDDNGFILPPLIEREHVVVDAKVRPGMLFSIPAADLREQREERRITIESRCSAAAEIANRANGPSVVWCHLNPEGDMLERMIEGAVQVSGSQADEVKEEHLLAFQRGEVRRLVIKPKIGCFGLNWQHCHDIVCFPSHSFEQYYQAVRRCWRFGQKQPVSVTVISTEGEQKVLANLQRKSRQADEMFRSLTVHMTNSLRIDHGYKATKQESLPAWLGDAEQSNTRKELSVCQ